MATTRKPASSASSRIREAAIRAIFDDLAEMRVLWTDLQRSPSDQHAVDRIGQLHESIKRWTSIYRAAR